MWIVVISAACRHACVRVSGQEALLTSCAGVISATGFPAFSFLLARSALELGCWKLIANYDFSYEDHKGNKGIQVSRGNPLTCLARRMKAKLD